MASSDDKVEPGEKLFDSGIDEDQIKIDVKTGLYDGVHRNMKQRHIQMIALAGTLGTGLFLGSGKVIAHAGPAGALLAFIHVGTITYCMLMSLGEMMCYMPISGGCFLTPPADIHFAGRFLDPAMGFALGWLQWYSGVVSLPNEIIGATLIIGFWDSGSDGSGLSTPHLAGYITVLLFLCAAVNFLGVRWFGESEFIFALIKIVLVLGCIIGGLVIDLGGGPGHERLGFRYWKPRRALAKAVKRVLYRILTFYVLGILVVGTAADSPFVLTITRVGIKGLPSVINAGILTSALSSANAGLYETSRQIYGLALRGQAPRILAKTTKGGLPIAALTFSTIWIVLPYMVLSQGASTVLNWLTNLVAIFGFCTWGIISLTYIRFYHGLKHQGIDRTKFTYWNRFQPYPAYWALSCLFYPPFIAKIPLTQIHREYHYRQWVISDFIIAYINIPIFVVLYGTYKIFRRSKIASVEAMDFLSNVPPPEAVDIDEPAPGTVAGKISAWLF
ncbi:amino acid permease/ SLC12A domain-containing protein [Mycena galericulata]|nr:amino acid permease/ SLC12A domain-containing protein [Mycena galericulata]